MSKRLEELGEVEYLLVLKKDSRHVNKDMKAYSENSGTCSRSFLFQNYDDDHSPVIPLYRCCDVYESKCLCGQCEHLNNEFSIICSVVH